ncbi:MAG: pteridine reductase [Pseudomonadales bacterium]|nr:pteridine reductase [Pseudomonadales bacterium]
MNQTNHPEKVVLITGAARRIGAEMARQFHHAGFNVALHFNASEQAVRAIAQELNTKRENSAKAFQAELGNIAQLQQMAQRVIAWHSQLDVLINNASSFYPTPLDSATEDDWHNLMDSNLKGPYFLCQATAEALQVSHGAIINIADIHARQPLKQHSIYCIAKAGNLMLTKALAQELAPDIRVNGIAPGAILWPEQAPLDEPTKQKIISRVPAGRTGSPEEIARLALFLAQDASYITGHIINMDGGRNLN